MRQSFAVMAKLMVLASFCFFLLATESLAQNWLRLDDLPTSVTTSVIRDRDGFVWSGTHVGLVRSDGHRSVSFRPDEDDSGSISSAAINVGALLEATDGSIWIGTQNGLCRHRMSAGTFDCLSPLGVESGIRDSLVVSIAEAPDGSIWAGTTKGLYVVDPSSFSAEEFSAYAPDADKWVNALAIDDDNVVWLGTRQGLYRKQPGATQFEQIPGIPEDAFFQDIEISPTGDVWIGTFFFGLFRVVAGAHSAEPVAVGSNDLQIVALKADNQGRLWIGTWNNGLYTYNSNLNRATHFLASSTEPGYIPSNEVVDIDIDKEGIVWIATWSGVAYKPPDPRYTFLGHDPAISTSLSHSRVTRMARGPDGMLWIATFGGGINRCDPQTLVCEHFRNASQNPSSLCHDSVLDIVFPTDSTLWAATSGRGVCEMNLRTGVFSPPFENGFEELAIANVYTISSGETGETWVGSAEYGLLRGDTRTGLVNRVEEFPRTSVYSIGRHPSGQLWFGTLGSGLCTKSTETGFRCLRRASDQLSDDWVTAIVPDDDGLWIGTTSGLDWLTSSGEIIRIIDSHDLEYPHTSCVLPTESGIWASTASGLVRIDSETRNISHVGSRVGLPTRGFLRPACIDLGDNRIAFGSENGVFFFDTAIVDERVANQTFVTSVSVDGSETHSIPLTQIAELTIGPDQSGPTFRFTEPFFNSPEARLYTYLLDGVDSEWSSPTRISTITYPKLPPGRYTFRVKAAFHPAANEATVELRVLPPLWQRWWFITLVALTIASIFVALYRARVRYLLQIERTRIEIADDLHDDLGSRLSGLALGLDMAANKAAPQNELGPHAEEARSILSDLRDTTWVVGGSDDTVGSLANRTLQIAETLLPNADVELQTKGDMEAILDIRRRRQVLFFCKEALHNAAKHGDPQSATIMFEVSPDNRMLIAVRDDGVGFDDSGNDGRGIESMQRRANALSGSFDIRSSLGKGTRASLTFML